jgi:hypothetical protein
MQEQSKDAPHCSQLPGLKLAKGLICRYVTPTNAHERTTTCYGTAVLKGLHVPVSASLVFILRDVLNKGYFKKASKTERQM